MSESETPQKSGNIKRRQIDIASEGELSAQRTRLVAEPLDIAGLRQYLSGFMDDFSPERGKRHAQTMPADEDRSAEMGFDRR